MFYSLDKLKTKTKNQIFFVGENENLTTFLYILNRGDKKTFFLEGEKKFSCLCQQQQKKWFLLLVFGFQFIQRIEHWIMKKKIVARKNNIWLSILDYLID